MLAMTGLLLDRTLRRLYAACAGLAGLAIVVIAVAVMISIGSRAMGIYIPGMTEAAGYGMASAGALGLAHTAINGGHVRVDLVLSRLSDRPRHRLELVALVASALAICYAAWALYRLVVNSLRFGDLSSNSDGLPLWMPQFPLAVGFVVFAISLLHLVVLALTGRPANSPAPEEGPSL
ncbi:MAG: TRAP transporter small permease subunit [Gemmobacter sp.]|nr:TRAP transporter small permease subunit [Gemmobacter sp.]